MNLTSNNLYIYGIAGVVLILLIFIIFFLLKSKNKPSNKDIKIVDGVRYDKKKKGNSFVEGDILLKRGEKYKVEKNTRIIPGKYIILSADESAITFNVRLGGFVREFEHNSSVVLSEGDEICPVSHNVILR